MAASEAAIDRWHDPSPDAMLRVALAPCSPFSVTGELMRDSAELARARGVRLHTHLAETIDEEDFCRERFGCLPAGVRRGAGLDRRRRVVRPRHPPRRRRRQEGRRHPHRHRALPVVQRAARRGHRPHPGPARRRRPRRAGRRRGGQQRGRQPAGGGPPRRAVRPRRGRPDRAHGPRRAGAGHHRRRRRARPRRRDRLDRAGQARRPRALADRRARPRRRRRPGRRAGARRAAAPGPAAREREAGRRARTGSSPSTPTRSPASAAAVHRIPPGEGADDHAPRPTHRRGGRIGDSPLRPDGTLKVTGEFAYSSRPVARRHVLGRHAAQPAPARPHRVDRHRGRARAARRLRRAHRRRRARRERRRARAPRPAGAGRRASSATRASRSRWSPPTTRRPPGAPRSRSW